MLPTFDTHQINSLPEQLQNSNADIFPFKEYAAFTIDKIKEEKQAIQANELFSIFTANIITEKVVFIR